jgi:hypothetical protein
MHAICKIFCKVDAPRPCFVKGGESKGWVQGGLEGKWGSCMGGEQ